jgi:undecaprenyl-diphosphatase
MLSERGKTTLLNLVSSGMSRLGRYEPIVLIAVIVAAGSIWAFVELAEEMIEGDTKAFDRWLVVAMRNPEDLSDPVGPKWIEEMGRDLTALGGVGVLSLLALASAGFLLLGDKRRSAVFLLGAVAGGLVLSFALKSGFDRPRPDLVPHGAYVYTTSFPSGHAMMSAVTFLTLGSVLAQSQRRRRLKAYLILLALLITLAVGVSRVYLGVHWPTDVLAGWAVGAGWALLCWLIARWLQKRGAVEDEDD